MCVSSIDLASMSLPPAPRNSLTCGLIGPGEKDIDLDLLDVCMFVTDGAYLVVFTALGKEGKVCICQGEQFLYYGSKFVFFMVKSFKEMDLLDWYIWIGVIVIW